MWGRKEDSTSEEARKKEVAKEDKHNLKRSPVQNKYNHSHKGSMESRRMPRLQLSGRLGARRLLRTVLPRTV